MHVFLSLFHVSCIDNNSWFNHACIWRGRRGSNGMAIRFI